MYDESGHLLGEYDTNAQTLQETIYLGGTPVAVVTPTGPAIVVDNTSTGTVAVGTWSSSSYDPNYIGPNYQYHAASTGTDSFTWPVVIVTTGSYHVYARWTADTNRSTAATYTVGSNTAVHENQTTNNAKWMLLGTYTLSAGTTNIKLTTDASGDVIADAVKAVLVSQDSSSTYYIYPDQVDAPRMVTRPSDNQMVWRWDQSDPFGAAAPNQNPASLGTFVYNPRFPGQLYDQENNLSYNYFRNYDPTLGRYVQSDPIGLNAGSNTYAYADGNPVREIDPWGLMGAGGGGSASHPQPAPPPLPWQPADPARTLQYICDGLKNSDGYIDRDLKPYDLSWRDAEHYLYSYTTMRDGGIAWPVTAPYQISRSYVYSFVKWQLPNLFDQASPPSWGEANWGAQGVFAGLAANFGSDEFAKPCGCH